MNRYLKQLGWGFVIWVIPFVASFFVWDVEAGGPSVSQAWFNGIMAFTWGVGLAIALYYYFKDVKKDVVKEGWTTGLVWYVELVVLDFIALVQMFSMPLAEFYPMFLVYGSVVFIAGAVGHLKK